MWTEKELKQEQKLINKYTKICKEPVLSEKEGRKKKKNTNPQLKGKQGSENSLIPQSFLAICNLDQ